MSQRRPFISRKPTKDPQDYVDEQVEVNGERQTPAGADKEAAKMVASKDGVSIKSQEKKKEHKQFRDVKFTPQTTAFDTFNPRSGGSFHGFFALFWLAFAFLVIKTYLQHWRATGYWTPGKLMTLYRLNVGDLAATDAAMVCSSVVILPLQLLMLYGVSWNGGGWVVQHIWQTFYICYIIHRSYTRNWEWVSSVFIVLHAVVMLMKMHSYAMYNGYLSEVYKRRNKLEKRLVQMRKDGNSSKTTSTKTKPKPERKSSESEDSVDSSSTLGNDSVESVLATEIAELSDELTHDGVTYPQNLTLWNYIDYLLVPSLVYDISFPRTEKIRWSYVAERTVATLGTFFLMSMIVEHYVLPVIPANLATMTTVDKLMELPWLMLDMVFPFISLYLLTFYIIFECVCQWFAEMTCFADRNFYDDWWNSVSWDEFARNWNKPVHRFLLRHVYHSSISTLQVSKNHATLITFLLSSLVHEAVMACMTKKIRLYLLSSQMLQLPLVALSRMPFLKRHPVAGNIFFWFGLFCGPSFLCLAYVLF